VSFINVRLQVLRSIWQTLRYCDWTMVLPVWSCNTTGWLRNVGKWVFTVYWQLWTVWKCMWGAFHTMCVMEHHTVLQLVGWQSYSLISHVHSSDMELLALLCTRKFSLSFSLSCECMGSPAPPFLSFDMECKSMVFSVWICELIVLFILSRGK